MEKRKRKFLWTSFQKKIFFLVFVAAIAPATIVALSLDYLIYNLFASQAALPEAIVVKLIPLLSMLNLIIVVTIPVNLVLIGIFAWILSYRIAGPVYRIEKELEERITGSKQGPITLRRNDELQSLVEKVNKLLAK
ncbi:MAG: hypothetical protein WC321_04530 [Candidatus Omnitrophota bacterium]|jgi:methyl-accepting chemotaxis protein